MIKKLFIFTDGGARGNPGPAAVGVVVKDEQGQIVGQIAKKIGETTNNVVEYTAVIEALRWIVESRRDRARGERLLLPSCGINFFLDSRLVVNQLNGLFKVKDGNLRELIVKVRELEQAVGGNVSYTLIPREKNWQADSLVNQALDS